MPWRSRLVQRPIVSTDILDIFRQEIYELCLTGSFTGTCFDDSVCLPFKLHLTSPLQWLESWCIGNTANNSTSRSCLTPEAECNLNAICRSTCVWQFSIIIQGMSVYLAAIKTHAQPPVAASSALRFSSDVLTCQCFIPPLLPTYPAQCLVAPMLQCAHADTHAYPSRRASHTHTHT